MSLSASRVAARYILAKAFLLRDPHKELEGETIEVSLLPAYEKDVARLAREYKRQKLKMDRLPSGKAKGLAGHQLAQVGAEGRKARARAEIAKSMKTRGLLKIKF